MAHDFAKINVAIWTDQDWKSLTRDEQWLYFLLVTHPHMSAAGVCDWRPGRLAGFSGDTTAAEVRRIAAGLQAKRFVLVDEQTEEILVRPYIKHDQRLKQPNTAKSVVKAYGVTASRQIGMVIIHELQKIRERNPDFKGFTSEGSRQELADALKQPAAPIEDFIDPSGDPSRDPSVDPSIDPSPDPSVEGQANPSGDPSVDPSPTETETYTPSHEGGAGEMTQLFEQWWKHYPKKVDKGQARKAFKTALGKTDIATLTAGVTRYAQSVASTEPRFIKNPSTWLNAEAWDNQPAEAERPRTAWDYGPEAYIHPEEIEYERRASAAASRDSDLPF